MMSMLAAAEAMRMRRSSVGSCTVRAITLATNAGTLLRDIMSTDMTVATPETTVEDLRKMFTTITGLPVVESAATRKLVGVVSKKDLEKDGKTVSEVGRCCIRNCWLRCGVKTWPSPQCPRHGGPGEDGPVQHVGSDPVSALPLDLPIILKLMLSCCFGL
jgi:CBS domain